MKIEKITQLSGHKGAVYALGEGRTPQHIFTGAGDGWLVEWDLANHETGRLIANVEKNIFCLKYLKNQQRVVIGDMDGGIRFVDLENPDKTLNIKHHSKGCYNIQSFDNQLFTLGGEGIITRWSAEESRSIESLQLSSKSLRSMAISAPKREIVVGASDGNMYFLDIDNFNLKHTIYAAHQNSIFTVRYTPSYQHILTGGRDAFLKMWQANDIWNNNNLKPIFSIPAHLFTINAIAFHPSNNQIFATASRDKTIKIWQIEEINSENTEGVAHHKDATITLLKVIDTVKHGCHIRSVNNLYWSTFNNYLISASDDYTAMVWKIDI